MPTPTVAVVIPAFRAEETIAAVIAGVPPFVGHVIVVDDASPDRTGEVAASSGDLRVRVVTHAENQGVGGATLRGYEEALELGAEIIAKMDADGQMDPRHLWSLIAPLAAGRADYAKGNRFLHWPELESMPLGRRIGNAGLSLLTKAASGYWNVFDPTNGFTAIHAAVIPLLDPRKIDRRFFFESSLLIELGVARAVVADVPMPALYAAETSSLSEWTVLATFPRKLLRGLLRRWTIHYLLRDFTAFSVFLLCGLCLTAFGAAWGAYHWWLSYLEGVVASTGTVMIAVLPITIGLQLLIQCIVLEVQGTPTWPIHLSRRSSPPPGS